MGLIPLPRLTKRDVEEITRAHQELVAADQALQTTNWAAAPMVRIAVGHADMVLCRLFNKAEAAVIRRSGAQGTETPSGELSEASTGEEASQDENAAPGKDGA